MNAFTATSDSSRTRCWVRTRWWGWLVLHKGAAGRACEGAVRIPGLHRQRCRSDRGAHGWRAVEVEHILEIAGVRIPGGETRQREPLLQKRKDRGMRADGM